MRSLFICTLITLFISFNCKDKDPDSGTSVISDKGVTMTVEHDPNLPYVDTSITLTAVSDINNRNISQKDAEHYIYKHFKNRGVINRSDCKADSQIYQETICVQYDTLYNINSLKFTGAIISYWLGVCDLSGHCFQPSKAIIVRTQNGYKISDEIFIPTNFSIDSIRNTFIYGYDYECGGRGIVRQFKIQLR